MQWKHDEDDTTGIGGNWHGKTLSLKHERNRSALTVGYNAADSEDGYEVGISVGDWTDETEDSKGFVEGRQRAPVIDIGAYETEAEAHMAMLTVANLAGDNELHPLGITGEADDPTPMPAPMHEARNTVLNNRVKILEMAGLDGTDQYAAALSNAEPLLTHGEKAFPEGGS